ncbi:MAG: beta-lactamase family protein [Saprospiraceae bacterium]|nr:beta-lactamase family protein [Saprospiraceae bacterium]
MRYIYPLLLFLVVLSACTKDADDPTLENPTSDFWEFGDPANLGFDLDSLNAAVERASSTPSFYGLVVIRNEKIALERYFKGRNASTLFHLRSITKNVTSAVTGMALERGILSSLDTPAGQYLSDLSTGAKSDITLRHLLNMTSGLQWDEDAEVVPLIEHRFPDPVQMMTERPLVAEPGSTFNYNSVSPHLVSHILTQETGERFEELVEEMLLKRLGIENSSWEYDPQGRAWGGFGLQLTGRDLAKFGLLYLQNGVWEGNQLVPQSWVNLSSEKQYQFTHPSSGYSLQWWTSSNFGGIFYGIGHGGQALMIIPSKNMIVLALQEHFVPGSQHTSQWRRFADSIFPTLYHAAR